MAFGQRFQQALQLSFGLMKSNRQLDNETDVMKFRKDNGLVCRAIDVAFVLQ